MVGSEWGAGGQAAAAIVFDDELRHVILVHHNKIGKWLYPGGHVEENQAPAEAAIVNAF